MLCPVYGHELTPLSCPPSQGVSFRSFKGLIILSPYINLKKVGYKENWSLVKYEFRIVGKNSVIPEYLVL